MQVILNMESNEQTNLVNKKVSLLEVKKQITTSQEKVESALTNEEKLAYLSKLIQAADQEFEASELNKKLTKKK